MQIASVPFVHDEARHLPSDVVGFDASLYEFAKLLVMLAQIFEIIG
jgi:hypothetical protein